MIIQHILQDFIKTYNQDELNHILIILPIKQNIINIIKRSIQTQDKKIKMISIDFININSKKKLSNEYKIQILYYLLHKQLASTNANYIYKLSMQSLILINHYQQKHNILPHIFLQNYKHDNLISPHNRLLNISKVYGDYLINNKLYENEYNNNSNTTKYIYKFIKQKNINKIILIEKELFTEYELSKLQSISTLANIKLQTYTIKKDKIDYSLLVDRKESTIITSESINDQVDEIYQFIKNNKKQYDKIYVIFNDFNIIPMLNNLFTNKKTITRQFILLICEFIKTIQNHTIINIKNLIFNYIHFVYNDIIIKKLYHQSYLSKLCKTINIETLTIRYNNKNNDNEYQQCYKIINYILQCIKKCLNNKKNIYHFIEELTQNVQINKKYKTNTHFKKIIELIKNFTKIKKIIFKDKQTLLNIIHNNLLYHVSPKINDITIVNQKIILLPIYQIYLLKWIATNKNKFLFIGMNKNNASSNEISYELLYNKSFKHIYKNIFIKKILNHVNTKFLLSKIDRFNRYLLPSELLFEFFSDNQKILYDLINEIYNQEYTIKTKYYIKNNINDNNNILKIELKNIPENYISASAINTYLKNPLLFYMKYVLKMIKPYIFDINNLNYSDIGNIYHKILHDIIKNYINDYKIYNLINLNKNKLKSNIYQTCIQNEYLFKHTNKQHAIIIENIYKNIIHVFMDIVNEYNHYNWIPKYFEKSLTMKIDNTILQKWSHNSQMQLQREYYLTGRIDRIDYCANNKNIIKIIDYKTGVNNKNIKGYIIDNKNNNQSYDNFTYQNKCLKWQNMQFPIYYILLQNEHQYQEIHCDQIYLEYYNQSNLQKANWPDIVNYIIHAKNNIAQIIYHIDNKKFYDNNKMTLPSYIEEEFKRIFIKNDISTVNIKAII